MFGSHIALSSNTFFVSGPQLTSSNKWWNRKRNKKEETQPEQIKNGYKYYCRNPNCKYIEEKAGLNHAYMIYINGYAHCALCSEECFAKCRYCAEQIKNEKKENNEWRPNSKLTSHDKCISYNGSATFEQYGTQSNICIIKNKI